MKKLLVSAGLVAGAFTGLNVQAVPAMAAEQQVCEGSAVYCEQFAYNCTTNQGRFINLNPRSQRFVTYSCELPEGSTTDLFQSGLAGLTVTPITSNDDNDHAHDDGDDDPSDNTPSNDDPGNNPGNGGGTGTTGGDDGNGNIL